MVGVASSAEASDPETPFQMLEWTTAAGGARFAGIVHHTDAAREWPYDRNSSEGHLEKALDAAQSNTSNQRRRP
jgi:hypothetical protein